MALQWKSQGLTMDFKTWHGLPSITSLVFTTSPFFTVLRARWPPAVPPSLGAADGQHA